jgi:hypothetical protein
MVDTGNPSAVKYTTFRNYLHDLPFSILFLQILPTSWQGTCTLYDADGSLMKMQINLLILSVCILLSVLDQVQRFPSNATLFQ